MPFTAKQLRFIDEYLICFNGTQAVKRAGFSAKSAKEIAYQLRQNPEIQKEIERRLAELSLTPSETLKSISDIAKGSLNDYMTIRQVVHTAKKRVHLSELIADLKAEIEDANKFFVRLGPGISDEEKEFHAREQASRQRMIFKLEIQLERNPKATKLIDDEPQLIETAELDLAALARAKDAGRIKSFSVTDSGVKVELYPADAALRDLAKVHGLFREDNAQKKPEFPAIMILPSNDRDKTTTEGD